MARSVEIYRDKGATSRSITIEITADGDVKMEGYDIGEAPKLFYGDSDYEFWVIVKREHKDKLLRALIERTPAPPSAAPSRSASWLRALIGRNPAPPAPGAGQADARLLALIKRDFRGKASAVDDFREFLDANAIPCEAGSWA